MICLKLVWKLSTYLKQYKNWTYCYIIIFIIIFWIVFVFGFSSFGVYGIKMEKKNKWLTNIDHASRIHLNEYSYSFNFFFFILAKLNNSLYTFYFLQQRKKNHPYSFTGIHIDWSDLAWSTTFRSIIMFCLFHFTYKNKRVSSCSYANRSIKNCDTCFWFS